MGKLERQLAIWRKLASHDGGVTLRDLAREFAVAKNTIQRDIDGLTLAGVPIQANAAGQTLRYSVDQAPSGASLPTRESGALDPASAPRPRGAPTPQ